MDEISNIRFNLTPVMADKIVEINDLKFKLLDINEQIKNSDNQELQLEKAKLEEEMVILKKKFIKEFQNNNQYQISKYLELKNKED